MPHGMEAGLGPGDFVFNGERPRKMDTAPRLHPIFGPCLLSPNDGMDQEATWYGDKPRPRRCCVRLGRALQFSVPVYCGQMAAWMKTPLGMEVDLGACRSVRGGRRSAAKAAQQPPSFRPMSTVATVVHLSYY